MRDGKEEERQLKLFSLTAEKSRKATDGEADSGGPRSATCAGAKRENKERKALPTLTMEEKQPIVTVQMHLAFE